MSYDLVVEESESNDHEEWTVRHFSQSNPIGKDQEDVPNLLRRVANTIEEMGPSVNVQDLVMHVDIEAEGIWPSITVYYHIE